nr:class F sortase [Streptomyces somaliensis]
MAPRRPRYPRFDRRQRRLLRLARTAVLVLLVFGGVRWAQGGEPPGPAPVAAPQRPASTAPAPPPTAESKAGRPAGPRTEGGAGRQMRSEAPKPSAKPPPAPLPPSPPERLAVPALTVEAPVMRLDLDGAGRLRSPPVDHPELVGWYEGGASPGEEGTAIVVGHRDTRTGPAVFLNLHALKPGNTVRVERADGITAVFTVDRVRTYDKDEFPDREVYRQAERPELRLLTCGGTFDRRKGYTANTVVFAHLVDTVRTDARRA